MSGLYSSDGMTLLRVPQDAECFSVPEGVVHIAEGAFAGCRRLTSLHLPEGVEDIADGAFFNAVSLRELSLPHSLHTIADDAFMGCQSISHINLPSSVKFIGSNAFAYCRSLESVALPDNLEDFGQELFLGCSSLKTVFLSRSVEYVDGALFVGCSALDRVEVDEQNAHYKSLDGVLYSKDGLSLVFCPANKAVTRFEIPNGVSFICDGAFSGADKLEECVIPPSVENIGNSVWMGCWSLRSFVIAHEGFFSSSDGILYQNSRLVCCPPSTPLKTVVIDQHVTDIADGAFAHCKSIERVVFGTQFLSLPNSLFDGCSALVEVILPDSLEVISDFVFRSCISLSGLDLPCNLTRIGSSAFCGCSSLANIVIPSDVEEIGPYAFSRCVSLSSIVLPDRISIVSEGLFDGCSSLSHVDMPDTVTVIGEEAFSECTSLSSVDLSMALEEIKGGAFCMAGLSSVVIPHSVKHIASMAFYGCEHLSMANVPRHCVLDDNSFAETEAEVCLF